MGSDERRGGIGFGNQRRVDGGRPPVEEDDGGESTRAMDVGEFEDAEQPTTYSRNPAPPPPPRSPAGPAVRPGGRPGAAASRAAPPPPPPPSHDEPEEDAATRMLDAMDVDDLPGPAARSQAPQRQFDLKVVSGPDRGKVHKLVDGDYLVGRGLDCQIVLADPAVSRKHFQVRRNGDVALLEDLGGPNGTKVNGEKRARHNLEPGDQIEVGMTVLEFQIDGQGKRQGGRQAGIEDRSQRPESRGIAQARPVAAKGGGPGKMIAIVAGLLVLLVGGGIAAWLVLGGKGGGGSEAAEEGDQTADSLVADAKKAIADKDFVAAVAALKKAKEIDKSHPELGPLLRKASGEADNQATLEEARKALKDGNVADALKKLEEIKDKSDSAFAAEADAEFKGALAKFVADKLAEAKAAQAAGDTAKAQAAVTAVLEHDAGNAEAGQLQAALGGGAAPVAPPAADAGAPPAPGADAGAAAAAAEPAAAVPAAGAGPAAAAAGDNKAGVVAPAEAAGAKKADFDAGLKAYGARQFSAAVQAFDAIANGPFPKEEKKKAATFAAAVKKVEAAWNEAQSAAGNPKKAAGAWKTMREADGDVNGAHKAHCTDQLIKAYVAAAKTARAAGNCQEAVEQAEEANNYTATGSHPDTKAVIDGCKADGKKLLDQAEAALAAGKGQVAKELAIKAEKILGMDPLAQKAKDIQKKAAAAGRGDE